MNVPVRLLLVIAMALAACEGSDSGQDVRPGTDVIIPADPGASDQAPPQDVDTHRDPSPADPGTQDTVPIDPGSTDTSPADPGVGDPGTQDTVPIDPGPTDTSPADPGVGDPGIDDPGPVDPGSQDVPSTGDLPAADLPAADVPPFECTGPCDPDTQSLQCMPDGLTICYCNPDSGNWEPHACGEVCTANGMVGTACVLGQEGRYTCDCSFDCGQPDLVATQCDQLYYTPCTCASADPCGWIGDDFCDADCATSFPEDHFVDTADCTCGGACNPEEFSEYCDLDGNPCRCGADGNQVSIPCDSYCADQGAVVRTDERCTTFWGTSFCNCQDWTCEDPVKVQNQCQAEVLTPCTCAAADPCGYIGDGYCDSEACNSLYPDQQNLDDSAQDCQG
ncbi:hypothetical protein KBD49_09190 [Myxococcota bacterium]|nr:hypothetical protein [Myxococcota bacterium]